MNNAANFFVQMRFHTNVVISILDRNHKEDLRISVEGADLSLCKPIGPINLKISLMLRKLTMDTYFRGSEIANGNLVERQRQGIFGDPNKGSIRQTKAPASYSQVGPGSIVNVGGFMKTNLNSGEQLMNILCYRKL